MKKIIIYILFVFAANMAAAQCYQPNVDKGNAALANGKYAEAYEFYSKATKCPDASRFNNGQEAKENMKKCLPVLTIEGKQAFEMTVGPEAGERTFNVQSKHIRMWIIDGGHRRQNITIDPKQITNDWFHAQWEANPNNTPRDLKIRLYGVDGVKDIDAYIIIHQAAGGLRVNGEEDKEYLSSWEGNAIRFDITGIPAGGQYRLNGIDTSWITIQKHSLHFFALIKPNKTTNSRSNRITISSNNQNVTITIRQKGSLGTNDFKSLARVPTKGLRVSPNATIPIRVRSKKKVNSSQNTDTYTYTYTPGFLNAQGEVITMGSNLVLSNRYSEHYYLRNEGIYQINNNCFLHVTLDTLYKQKIGISEYTNNYYSATLYSYNDKRLNKLGQYKFNTGYKQKEICIHRFNNDDFAIWIELETEEAIFKNPDEYTYRYVRYQCELYRYDGHLYFKDYAHFNPSIYEDGIVLCDMWTNWNYKKGFKEWYEHYLIRRNGTKVTLPKDAEIIYSIKDGIIRFSKESKHTSEGVHLREYGFCDLNGKIFIKPQYFYADDFSEGLAVVRPPLKGGYCHIDKYGNVINAGKYAWKMKPFSDGLAMVYGGDYPYCPSFINKNGKIQLSLDSYRFPEDNEYLYYDSYKLYNYHEGVAWALKKVYSKYCLINKNGEKITDSLFDDVTLMHSGLAGIYKKNNNKFGGLWGIINNKGNIIVSPRCANPPQFSPDGSVRLIGECLLTIDSLGNVFDGANVNGIEVTPTSDSLYIYSVNGIYGYYNNTLGIISIPARFNKALSFSDNLAAVQVGSKWGYINRTGKQIIPTVFDQAKSFHNGIAEVVIDGKTYSIDKKGIIQ